MNQMNSTCFNPSNSNTRIEEFRSRVLFIENKMGLEKSSQLKIGKFHKSACAYLSKNLVRVPSWFLLKCEDIPAQFRITSMEDPRLCDENFLNSMAYWINEKFDKEGITSIITPASYGALQRVIKLMRSPELYEKSKDFTIAHELAHLNHNQLKLKTFSLHKIQKVISVFGFTGGILLFALSLLIIPVVSAAVTLAMGGIAATVSIGSVALKLNTEKPLLNDSIMEEKRADLDAVKTLKDAEGAIYLFETYLQQNRAIRQSHSFIKNYHIDKNGNNLGDKKHPLLTERVAYLRDWRSKQFLMPKMTQESTWMRVKALGSLLESFSV